MAGGGSCRDQQLVQAQDQRDHEEASPGCKEEQESTGCHQAADPQPIEMGPSKVRTVGDRHRAEAAGPLAQEVARLDCPAP
jgi:cytochrome c2